MKYQFAIVHTQCSENELNELGHMGFHFVGIMPPSVISEGYILLQRDIPTENDLTDERIAELLMKDDRGAQQYEEWRSKWVANR